MLRPDVDWENGNRLILSARVNLKKGMPWRVYKVLPAFAHGGIDVDVFVDNAVLRGTSARPSKSKDEYVDQVIDSIQPGQQFGIELTTTAFKYDIPGPQRAYLPFDFRSVYLSMEEVLHNYANVGVIFFDCRRHLERSFAAPELLADHSVY